MTDAYPSIDEFGPGSCTCQGTMTGCAVCATGNVAVRYGKPIPRLPDSTPDMRALGKAMGARHRAVAAAGTPGDRHGLSLSGACYGGTNWCAYCAFLQLRAQGVPVAYGPLTFAQIMSRVENRQPVVLPGRYGVIPYVFPSTYSPILPARGRSDAGFGGAHMVVAWAMSTSSSVIVSDSDFGSPARPVIPPHSIWTVAEMKAYWSAYQWNVCYATVAPPSFITVRWGPDVPAAVKAADPTGVRTVRAFVKAGLGYGSVVNVGDLKGNASTRGLFPTYGVHYGDVIEAKDLRALFVVARV